MSRGVAYLVRRSPWYEAYLVRRVGELHHGSNRSVEPHALDLLRHLKTQADRQAHGPDRQAGRQTGMVWCGG